MDSSGVSSPGAGTGYLIYHWREERQLKAMAVIGEREQQLREIAERAERRQVESNDFRARLMI